jgi:hypothetical protein
MAVESIGCDGSWFLSSVNKSVKKSFADNDDSEAVAFEADAVELLRMVDAKAFILIFNPPLIFP